MNFEDQKLVCRDCGNTFVWTAGEQEFYQKKGFENAPTRCPDCRKNKKQGFRGGNGGGGNGAPRPSFEITCSKCGRQDTVPFQPSQGRDVLCRDCFKASREAA